MRVPSAVLRRASILLISSVLLPGCERTPPAAPSNAAPPATPRGPASITLSLIDPSLETLPAGGGSAVVTATVADAAGNGVTGAAVAFAATAGVLSNAEAITDASGKALTTLTTGRESLVTAAVGDRTAAPLTVRVARSERLLLRVLTAPSQPRAGVDTVTFIASVSADPGVTAERFSWQFGDGSALQQTREDQTTHVYREAGMKTLNLVVDLSNGLRLAAGRSVQIVNPE